MTELQGVVDRLTQRHEADAASDTPAAFFSLLSTSRRATELVEKAFGGARREELLDDLTTIRAALLGRHTMLHGLLETLEGLGRDIGAGELLAFETGVYGRTEVASGATGAATIPDVDSDLLAPMISACGLYAKDTAGTSLDTIHYQHCTLHSTAIPNTDFSALIITEPGADTPFDGDLSKAAEELVRGSHQTGMTIDLSSLAPGADTPFDGDLSKAAEELVRGSHQTGMTIDLSSLADHLPDEALLMVIDSGGLCLGTLKK